MQESKFPLINRLKNWLKKNNPITTTKNEIPLNKEIVANLLKNNPIIPKEEHYHYKPLTSELLELLVEKESSSILEIYSNSSFSKILIALTDKIGEVDFCISYDKTYFLKALQIELTKKENQKDTQNINIYKELYEKIFNCSNLDYYLKNNNQEISFNLNNQEIKIPLVKLIEYLNSNNFDITTNPFGISSETLSYIISEFKNKQLEEIKKTIVELPILISENIEKSISQNQQYIHNVEKQKKYEQDQKKFNNSQVEFSFLNQIKINENFKNHIINSIPSDYTPLEKSIYAYIKLCDILSYDEEYFVAPSKRNLSNNHNDIKRLETIDENNNRVICYEFCFIYGEILKSMGINCNIIPDKHKSTISKYHADAIGHTSLKYFVDQYYIEAEAFMGIINNDTSLVKYRLPINGLTLVEKNDDDINNKFNNAIYKVFEQYKKDNPKVKDNLNKFILEYMINEHRNKTENKPTLSFEEKKSIFLDKISNCQLPPIERINYFQKINKTIFSQEQNKQTAIYFFRNNNPSSPNKKKDLALFVCFNDQNIIENYQDNEYYSLTSSKIEKYSHHQLLHLFQNNDFEMLTGHFYREIPGIISQTKQGGKKL